jgi:hypothetical protein
VTSTTTRESPIRALVVVSLTYAWLPAAVATAAEGTLKLRVVEGDAVGAEKPLPCRVHLVGPDTKPVQAPGLPFYRDHFSFGGEVDLRLAEGSYRFTVERGPEHRRAQGTVEIRKGQASEQHVVLERWIDMAARGWWSGDLHVHRPLDDMPLLLRAEDLHVAPVITMWNQRSLWGDRPLPPDLLVKVEPTRVFHVLACEDERRGGALLYFNLTTPLDLRGDGPEHPSPFHHLDEALAQRDVWVDVEKPFWWDAPTWVASGKVRSIGLANNHMCRATMYADEAWGRPRDAARLPPPRGNGFWSQELYYRFLNAGFRLPPSAGSASGVLPNPVGYNRVYVRIDGEFSYEAWWRSLAAGRAVVTNGPLLLVEANGKLPGEVFRADGGAPVDLALDVRAGGNDPLEAVEVVRDGAVVERIEAPALDAWLRPQTLRFERSGWFLVRALARVEETFRFASTAPFYVEVGAKPSRVHRADVEFFLAWIDERIAALEKYKGADLAGAEARSQVLAPHLKAREVFRGLLERAE